MSGWETNKGRQVKTEIRRAGHHQPDGETNEGRQVKIEIRRAGHHQPEWETNEGRQEIQRAGHHQPDWETNVFGHIGGAGHHHLDRGGHLLREN